jgi:hypothetical protein
MTHTTSEILDLAADAIQRDGWAQGTTGMHVGGPHCALGAIAHVTGARVVTPPPWGEYDHIAPKVPFYSYDDAMYHPAGEALAAYLPATELTVYYWNDAPVRQEWEVIAALRAAAAIERVKETSDEKVPA